MRDEHDLRGLTHLSEQLVEAADVGVVQGSVHLVQNAERARPDQEQRERETQRGQRLLPAGQELHGTQAFPRRLDFDFDSGLGQVAVIGQHDARFAAFDQAGVHVTEFFVHPPERVPKAVPRLAVELVDGRLEVFDRAGQIRFLGFDVRHPFLDLDQFLGRVRIDFAQPRNGVAQFLAARFGFRLVDVRGPILVHDPGEFEMIPLPHGRFEMVAADPPFGEADVELRFLLVQFGGRLTVLFDLRVALPARRGESVAFRLLLRAGLPFRVEVGREVRRPLGQRSRIRADPRRVPFGRLDFGSACAYALVELAELLRELGELRLNPLAPFPLLRDPDTQVTDLAALPVERALGVGKFGLCGGEAGFAFLAPRGNCGCLGFGLPPVLLQRRAFLFEDVPLEHDTLASFARSPQFAFEPFRLASVRFALPVEFLSAGFERAEFGLSVGLSLFQRLLLPNQPGDARFLFLERLPKIANFPAAAQKRRFRDVPAPTADYARGRNDFPAWRDVGVRPAAPIPQIQSDLQVGHQHRVAEQSFQHGAVFGRDADVFDEPGNPGRRPRFRLRNVVPAGGSAVGFRLQRHEAPIAGLRRREVVHGDDARGSVGHDHVFQLLPQYGRDRPLVRVRNVDHLGDHTAHGRGKRGVGHDRLHPLPVAFVPAFQVLQRLQPRTQFRAGIARRGQVAFDPLGVGQQPA